MLSLFSFVFILDCEFSGVGKETNPEYVSLVSAHSLLPVLRGLPAGLSELVTDKLDAFRLAWTWCWGNMTTLVPPFYPSSNAKLYSTVNICFI